MSLTDSNLATFIDTDFFGESITYDGNAVTGVPEDVEQESEDGELKKWMFFWFRKTDIAEPSQRVVIVWDSNTYYTKGDEWIDDGGMYRVTAYRQERRPLI